MTFFFLLALSITAGGLNRSHAADSILTELISPPGDEASLDFCERWNPEFQANGEHCCGRKTVYGRRGRRTKGRCDVHRNRASYCNEITVEQKEYISNAESGKVGDLLDFLTAQVAHRPIQAYCPVNIGFLVHGRAIIPTADNLIQLRSPQRCTYFATEPMVAMFEWLGRQIKKEIYPENPGVRLLIGDVAAPRGGCLAAAGGRRGHKSHTVGEDADVGLLTPRGKNKSPDFFHKDLQPKPNWWFLKQIFHNPYACIKVIFLDRKHINKLARTVGNDPEWNTLRRFIRHIKGHRDHFHVRVGDGPGQPGCVPNANPEKELEGEMDPEESSTSETKNIPGAQGPDDDSGSVPGEGMDSD